MRSARGIVWLSISRDKAKALAKAQVLLGQNLSAREMVKALQPIIREH